MHDRGFDRRKFLRAGIGVAAGSGIAAVVGQVAGTSTNAEDSRAAVGPLAPARTAPPLPADADFAKLGSPPFITPNPDFYRIDTALVVPQIRTEDWSLRIHGMVDKEVTFSYNDIRNRPLVERRVTLTCVSNEVGGPLISNAAFLGVDLVDLLDEAGVQAGAEQMYATSVDGWTCGTPANVALDPARGAMLAIGMNGEPLPVEHGFPARIVIPGLYGYVSATKWVQYARIHQVGRAAGVLAQPRLGRAGADQDRVPDRHPDRLRERHRRARSGWPARRGRSTPASRRSRSGWTRVRGARRRSRPR